MRPSIKKYVASICIAAALLSLAVCLVAPAPSGSMVADAFLLAGLAIAGELLSYSLPNKAGGSIGFIPNFAAAVLVPSWPSVAAVTIVRAALEVGSRREPIKQALNTAAHTLMEAVAVLSYLALGGAPLIANAGAGGLLAATLKYGLAAIIAFTIALLTNNIAVFAAIAIATGQRVRSVLKEATRATIVLDILTTPLVFLFAWVYAEYGPVAAATLWLPILGLRQVHRINIELERTNEELLELMVKSLEARDPYTSGHSRRVQQYSVTIARAVGLNESDVRLVGQAALLHDVGKIHEKYAPVLAKQDKLTSEEWAIIRDHPADGANLVATMSRLRMVVPAIRSHHENWDGTGYPDGIAGELIPLAARIIRFADTIDAMTTERPYRRPLTEAQVRSELVRCRGTQFDPAIADRLLSSAHWQTLFVPPAGNVPATIGRRVIPLSPRTPFAKRIGSA